MPLHLTFDDGPSPEWTPALLDALAACGATATFFVLGPSVARHPGIVRDALAAGHRVELHAHEHARHDRLTPDALRVDTTRALAALTDAGAAPTWWRTPWGRTTDATRDVAAELGLALVGWHVDTHDWRGDAADRMLDVVARDAPDGGIVLAHDGLGPGATRTGCAETVALVPLVAAWAATRGLDLTALPDPQGAAHPSAAAVAAR